MRERFHDSITGMVAAIIGMIPEGLYLLTSVALAVSFRAAGTEEGIDPRYEMY